MFVAARGARTRLSGIAFSRRLRCSVRFGLQLGAAPQSSGGGL